VNDDRTPDDEVEDAPEEATEDAGAAPDAPSAPDAPPPADEEELDADAVHAAAEADKAAAEFAALPLYVRTMTRFFGQEKAKYHWERVTAVVPFLRIVAGINIVIVIAGGLGYYLETRVTWDLDGATWAGKATVTAAKDYRDEAGEIIIAEGGVFLSAEDLPDSALGHIEQLVAMELTEVDVIDHAMYANMWDAMWWSVVTMTTVGFGDKYPITGPGRFLAVVVMFMSLFLLSSFTATFASAFVARRIEAGQEQAEDPWENHIIFCGWTDEAAPRVIQALDAGCMGGTKLQVIFLNHMAEDAMELNRRGYDNLDTRFVRGDFTREEDLDNAGLHAASAIIIIPDESDGTDADDTRTIEATMAMKVLDPEVKVFAHAISQARVANLHRAMVDDVVVTDSYTPEMLAAFVVRQGMTQTIHELLDPEEAMEFATVDIAERFVGGTVQQLFTYLKNDRNATLVGLVSEEEALGLESAMEGGDAYMVELIKEQIEEAGIAMAAEGAKTRVVINPAQDVEVSEDSKALVIRSRPARGSGAA